MSGKIWVVVQTRGDDVHPMALETLVAGQKLGAELGLEVEAVVPAGDDVAANALADWQLAGVRGLTGESLAAYTPGGFVGALAAAVAAETPAYLLFPHTYQSVDFVPRLAQAVAGALVPEAIGFRVEDGGPVFRRPVFGGKLQADVRATGAPVLVTVQSGAFSVKEKAAGAAEVSALDFAAAAKPDREILGVEEVAGEQVDLSAAERVIAVGRGIGGEDKMAIVEELAEVLGAEIGASRPVIDSGWLPRDRQIGSSGQTVAPKLYVAIGISGAIQHLVGMKGSQTVVAINKDASAPIFSVADYGIVGDLHEVVPVLSSAIREAKG